MATPMTPSSPVGPVGMPAGMDIGELLARAERLLERISNKIAELVDALNRFLGSIAGRFISEDVVRSIQVGMRKVHDLFDKLIRKMMEFIAAPGLPPRLFEAGDAWLNGVAEPSTTAEEDISTRNMEVDDYWEGPAAAGYKSTLEEQQAAYAAMVSLARQIKELLHQAAWGVIKFWITAIIGLVGAAAGLSGAIALVFGGVTAPAAPFEAAAAILGVLAAVGGGGWAVFIEFKGLDQTASAMREEARFNTSFSGDQWPRATAEGKWKAD